MQPSSRTGCLTSAITSDWLCAAHAFFTDGPIRGKHLHSRAFYRTKVLYWLFRAAACRNLNWYQCLRMHIHDLSANKQTLVCSVGVFDTQKITFFSFPRYHPDYFKALMTNGKNKYIMGSKTFPKLERPSFKGSLVSRSLETRGPAHNIFQGVREASEAVLLCKHYRREEPKRPKDFWDADSVHLPLRVLAQKVHPRKYQCPTLNGLFFIAWTDWWAYNICKLQK